MEGRIKGAAFREFVLWYEEDFGRQATMACFARLPPEHQELLDLTKPAAGILASTWYPAALINTWLDIISEGWTPEHTTQICRSANAFTVPRLIKGVYRFLFESVATPSLYARHIRRAWRQLHTTGLRTITIVSPGYAESIIEQWPAHHPVLCQVTNETMAAVFRMMKLQNVTLERVHCVSQGDPRCVTYVRWDP